MHVQTISSAFCIILQYYKDAMGVLSEVLDAESVPEALVPDNNMQERL
ncbi:hypothetical protein [Candidatus Sarmatiella mevalonica]|nr:hypothetical protein [Candidatus Sarmatiella mevalonica]